MNKKVIWQQPRALLCPSVLSANFAHMQRDIAALESNFDALHCDVMDGIYVPNITFGSQLVRDLRVLNDQLLDVHMMVVDPADKVEAFAAAGADILVFHIEAEQHAQRLLAKIRELGCFAGIALNPSTPVEHLRWLLPDLDMVLLMTVNPGFGGQSYIPQMTDKIRATRELLDTADHRIRLQVDGGVSLQNLDEVLTAGADMVVAGSAIFRADDPAAVALAMLSRMKQTV